MRPAAAPFAGHRSFALTVLLDQDTADADAEPPSPSPARLAPPQPAPNGRTRRRTSGTTPARSRQRRRAGEETRPIADQPGLFPTAPPVVAWRPPPTAPSEAPLTFASIRAAADAPEFVHSARTRAFRERCFPEASDAEWNDWKWQLRHRIRDLPTLERCFVLSGAEREAVLALGDRLPVGLTPYYTSLMDPTHASRGLRRSMIPVSAEFERTPGEADDPLNEDGDMPVPGLVHRYPDRVLFLVTSFCAVYCRYCTRSRLVGKTGEYHFNTKQFERALQYIEATPEIRDVLISGGDPLTMNDDRLDWLLSRLRAIPHVEFVRIGSKVPAVLPQRITPAFAAMLRRHQVWMSVHFMHPDEVTLETAQSCGRLADAGIPLGSQTVLTRDVNDDPETMKRLMQGLLRIRVRPYYIYQCDPIPGSRHFRTPVERGLEIIEALRGHTTGYAVPQFVIDAPGGGGKIPLASDAVVRREGGELILRNYKGGEYRYPDGL